MSFISQFFILNSRGDKIISKDYRSDISQGSEEIFFRKTSNLRGDVKPIFNEEGINFIHLKRFDLFFVITTRFNISPSVVLEFLDRLCIVFRDFIGLESEECFRKNFILIYEILDEIVSYGQIQTSYGLKFYVINEPHEETTSNILKLSSLVNFSIGKARSKSSLAINKPVHSRKNTQNEIYVDVIETVHCVLGPTGGIIRAEIDGNIIMKSYLLGQPQLSIALNENLVVGRNTKLESTYGGVTILDQVNFSELCQLGDFSTLKMIHISPPEGEFNVMSYRIIGPYNMPFRVTPVIEKASKFKLEVLIRVKACFLPENNATRVLVKIPVPKQTSSVFLDFEKPKLHQSEYSSSGKFLVWEIAKIIGGEELWSRIHISLGEAIVGEPNKHVGPISMSFEVPSSNTSDLRIKYLKVKERSKTYDPQSWIRYITTSGSFICRV